MLKITPNFALCDAFVKIRAGWARSLDQLLKPNLRNTFDSHRLRGCWARWIDAQGLPMCLSGELKEKCRHTIHYAWKHKRWRNELGNIQFSHSVKYVSSSISGRVILRSNLREVVYNSCDSVTKQNITWYWPKARTHYPCSWPVNTDREHRCHFRHG